MNRLVHLRFVRKSIKHCRTNVKARFVKNTFNTNESLLSTSLQTLLSIERKFPCDRLDNSAIKLFIYILSQ